MDWLDECVGQNASEPEALKRLVLSVRFERLGICNGLIASQEGIAGALPEHVASVARAVAAAEADRGGFKFRCAPSGGPGAAY